MEHGKEEYFKIKKAYLYALCSMLFCVAIAACTWGLDERQKPAVAACPTAFWVPDPVAGEFRKFPEGHPMREFFKAYVSQQRQLDAYHGYPGVHGAR
jgi:hypothetical protein